MVPLLFYSLCLVHNVFSIGALSVVFEWKQVILKYPDYGDLRQAVNKKTFIPENNFPSGLAVYKERIFLTIPRKDEGVDASLVYINKTGSKKSPALIPYPDWKSHDMNVPEPKIVSALGIRTDNCDRLWVLDSGASPNRFYKPKLLIFDLRVDKLIRSYPIPDDQWDETSYFSNIEVEEVSCDYCFGYLADSSRPALVVYDFQKDTSWVVMNQHFVNSPVPAKYKHSLSGIFGLALSNKDEEGFSTLYFHPGISLQEFKVSTKVLRNVSLSSDRTAHGEYFHLLGTRGGNNTHCGTSFFDKESETLYQASMYTNEIFYWCSSLSNYTEGVKVFSDQNMDIPMDIKVDSENIFWVLSSTKSIFSTGYLKTRQYNFKILKTNMSTANGIPVNLMSHAVKNITEISNSSDVISKCTINIILLFCIILNHFVY